MTSKIFATIITIGDELLIGQVIDTNSAFIAQKLNLLGITIKQRIAVGDDYNDIWRALDETKKHSQIIIITGGLGPTADDITKPLLCKYFNGEMIVDKETEEHVKHIFSNILKKPLLERNLKQAEVPNVCKVLKNEVGTAPGMLFEQNNILFFSLPGVPHEMKWLMQNKVLAILSEKYNQIHIYHKTLLTAGAGESFIAEKLIDFENKLPSNVKLAYLPNYGMVRLRLSGTSNSKIELEETINSLFLSLNNLLQDIVITTIDETLVENISNLLRNNNKTVSIAESCTGGFIAHQFTKLSGASAIFKGSVVAYSNEIKEGVLLVKNETIKNLGAVSEQVVLEMSKNILIKFKTDYSIAVSGIMGPNGGTEDKPLGTVWIAVASANKTLTRQLSLRFDREKNIEITCNQSLLLLRELIVDKH